MARPTRLTQQPDLASAIKDTAWAQIAALGASALSLRAIARQLGITAPAIYNYYPRRDDLVTALIIDAYASLGDSQFQARDAMHPEDHAGRLTATGIAYRSWALAYPQRYQLIFGTPIPDYAAPQQVFPVAARSLGALVSVVEALRLAGKLKVTNFPQVAPGYETAFALWKNYGGEADVLSLSVAVLIWSQVHGLVSLEIAGNIPPYGLKGDELYRYQLNQLNHQYIAG